MRFEFFDLRKQSNIKYIGLCLVIVIVASGCVMREQSPPSPMLSFQSRCAAYEFAPMTTIYTEDPGQFATISLNKSSIRLKPIHEAAARITLKPPICWTQYNPLIQPAPNPNEDEEPTTLAFLHTRTTSTGIERIVMLGLVLKNEDSPSSSMELTTRMNIVARVIEPGTSSTPPRVGYRLALGQGAESVENSNSFVDTAFTKGVLTVFAGKSDPSDSSKFYVPWEFNGIRHVMFGTLEEKNDELGRWVGLTLHGLP
jgi:hypothetical protein